MRTKQQNKEKNNNKIKELSQCNNKKIKMLTLVSLISEFNKLYK